MTPRPPRSPLFPYTPLFRSFGHVDLDDRVLRTKHLRGELLGELGLADAGRAHEHERADRAARVLEVGARAAQGDRKSTRLNSSHQIISYPAFFFKKKNHLLV